MECTMARELEMCRAGATVGGFRTKSRNDLIVFELSLSWTRLVFFGLSLTPSHLKHPVRRERALAHATAHVSCPSLLEAARDARCHVPNNTSFF